MKRILIQMAVGALLVASGVATPKALKSPAPAPIPEASAPAPAPFDWRAAGWEAPPFDQLDPETQAQIQRMREAGDFTAHSTPRSIARRAAQERMFTVPSTGIVGVPLPE